MISLPDDFFYEWFEGRLDFEEDLQLIDQSLGQSPRSDDDATPFGCSCGTISRCGSLLSRSYIPDNSHGASTHLKDCQGNALGVSGTKRAEIVVQDIDSTEAFLSQEFLISDVTNCILSLGGLMKEGWNIQKEYWWRYFIGIHRWGTFNPYKLQRVTTCFWLSD